MLFLGFSNDYGDDEEGVWRTINGHKVFIKKGMSIGEALRRAGITGDRAERAKGLHRKRKAQQKVEDKLLDEMFTNASR